MVNPEHLSIIKGKVENYEKWRMEHPDEELDLKDTDLSDTTFIFDYLERVDFAGANLERCNFNLMDLERINFTGANLKNCTFNLTNLDEVLFTSAKLVNVEIQHSTIDACIFTEANLSNAKLKDTVITLSNLNKVNLTNTDLTFCNISANNMIEADLSEADMYYAYIIISDLTNANLSKSELRNSTMKLTTLTNTNLTESVMGSTTFSMCDLSSCIGLDTINIEEANDISMLTIITTYRNSGYRLSPDVKMFYLNSGIPEEIVKELPRLISEIKYYSSFICYGSPDSKFAAKLVQDLKSRGVSCWLYSLDYKVGERTWREITQKRREADKMVVLCSLRSLMRPG